MRRAAVASISVITFAAGLSVACTKSSNSTSVKEASTKQNSDDEDTKKSKDSDDAADKSGSSDEAVTDGSQTQGDLREKFGCPGTYQAGDLNGTASLCYVAEFTPGLSPDILVDPVENGFSDRHGQMVGGNERLDKICPAFTYNFCGGFTPVITCRIDAGEETNFGNSTMNVTIRYEPTNVDSANEDLWRAANEEIEDASRRDCTERGGTVID